MKRTEDIGDFICAINALDKGERIALMRAAGSRLEDAPQAWPGFYSALPVSVPDWQVGRWFAAGCLRALWDPSKEPASPLPVILHDLRKRDEWGSYLRSRTVQLLETKWEDADGYLLTKITRLVKMLRQKGYRVDCGALLEDLLDWNKDSRAVQRRWASVIYRDKIKED